MSWINDFIMAVEEAGKRQELYSTINSVAFYIAILFGIFHGMKLKVGIVAVIISVLVERYLAGPIATMVIYVENGLVSTGKQNGVVSFVFVPLLGFLLAMLFRKSYKQMWDVLMVPPLVMFAGARFACTIAGCCRGYDLSWGIYNVKTGGNVFPIQLVEALVTILIIAFVIWREKKNKFIPDGKNVPIILMSYGVLRFILEFFHNNEKVIWGLASTQFHCLLMILVGFFTLTIVQYSDVKEKVKNSYPEKERISDTN